MEYKKIFIRRSLFALGISSLALVSPVLAASSGLTISQNLSLGAQNPAVITLQQILNSNPATEVAQNGPGSPGNETNYFGLKTQAAVMAFQSLHASQVLFPAGLSSPSGFVGPLTRSALNNSAGVIISSGNTQIQPTSTPVSSDPLASYRVTPAEQINIYGSDQNIHSIQQDISNTINSALASHTAPNINFQKYKSLLTSVVISSATHTGQAGSTITIGGRGFLSTNNIYIGPNFIIRNVAADISGTLSFTLPPLPVGMYDLVVSNQNGVSNSTLLVVQGQNPISVSITSVSPTPLHFGSAVTLTGSGFATSGNKVVTTFGTIDNASSTDGKTLTFTFAPDQLKGIAAAGKGTKLTPMGIQVINNNGYTVQPTQVQLGL